MPRHATTHDFDRLVDLARNEHAKSSQSHRQFDALLVQHTFGEFITGLGKTVLMTDGGFIMGLVQPTLFNRCCNAYEVAWYAEDGKGIDLLHAFIKWAKNMRADEIVVHNYSGIKSERFDRVIQRCGFKPIGRSYSLCA